MLSSGKWEGWGSTWRVLVNLQRTWVSVEPPLQGPQSSRRFRAISSAAQHEHRQPSGTWVVPMPSNAMPASVLRTFDLIRFTQQVESSLLFPPASALLKSLPNLSASRNPISHHQAPFTFVHNNPSQGKKSKSKKQTRKGGPGEADEKKKRRTEPRTVRSTEHKPASHAIFPGNPATPLLHNPVASSSSCTWIFHVSRQQFCPPLSSHQKSAKLNLPLLAL